MSCDGFAENVPTVQRVKDTFPIRPVYRRRNVPQRVFRPWVVPVLKGKGPAFHVDGNRAPDTWFRFPPGQLPSVLVRIQYRAKKFILQRFEALPGFQMRAYNPCRLQRVLDIPFEDFLFPNSE